MCGVNVKSWNVRKVVRPLTSRILFCLALVLLVVMIAPLAAAVPAPTFGSINPTAGPTTGGTAVDIYGTNFAGGGLFHVTIGGNMATSVVVDTPLHIRATTPHGTAGPKNVVITNNDGQTATGTGAFTYAVRPTVTGVSPIRGSAAGGTTVTVTGTGLTGATAVRFGTTAGTSLHVVSPTQITIISPAHAAGTVDVTVTTPGGTSATSSADRFTYVAPPAVTGVSPMSGPAAGGTTVTLTGTGLTGATAVRFGTTAGTSLHVVSPTQITIISPAHAAGTVDVTVTTPNGTSATSSADRFTYVAAPTVTGVSPMSGPTAGGTMVTITGTGLTGATAVKFGTTAGPAPTSVTSTQITIMSPAHAAGIVDVRVTTPGGTSATSSADRFTYVAAPTVTGVTPISGPAAGGTMVTITGTGFTGIPTVKFGTTGGIAPTTVTPTQITIMSPAHAAGIVDVRVTTPGGTSATSSADRFTYVAAPTVTGVTPISGPAAGGTMVTITGSGFTGTPAVRFGTTGGIAPTTVTPTHITIVSPAHAAGTVDVTVTTTGGTSATSSADRFTYVVPLTAIDPITGTPRVGSLLAAGELTPAGATATYQWQSSATSTGTYTDITGATAISYTPVTGDRGKYIKVAATGSGSYTGTVTSAAKGPVKSAITAIAPITGTPKVGSVLTAGALTPAGATATYQWQSSATSTGTYTTIAGATTNTYTPVAGDVSKYIRVAATGTGSYTGTVKSAAVGPVTAPLTAIGSITGTPKVGSLLTAGALAPAGATATYRWQYSATPGGGYTNIVGALSNIYTPVAGDVGKYIRVAATGTGSYTGTVKSAAVGPVKAPLTAIGPITGTPKVGSLLTSGILTPAGATASYQWQSAATSGGTYTNITGATATTYTPAAGYVGRFIRVAATGTGSYTGTVKSAAVGPVKAPLTAIGPITGTPRVGHVLTAGALTPAGATATYQWQSAATSGGTYTNIAGATATTYTPAAGYVGRFIKVAATGTGSYTGTVKSAAAGPVIA